MYVEGEGAQERQARSAYNDTVHQLLLWHPKTAFARSTVTMVHLTALGIFTVHAFLLRYSFDPILILNAIKSFLGAYMALVSMRSILDDLWLSRTPVSRLNEEPVSPASTRFRTVAPMTIFCCHTVLSLYHQEVNQNSQIGNSVQFKSY